jgi:hypothetical protein
VAVTHDRYFLDNVAGWILELDRGQGIPFEGNYSGVCGQLLRCVSPFEGNYPGVCVCIDVNACVCACMRMCVCVHVCMCVRVFVLL